MQQWKKLDFIYLYIGSPVYFPDKNKIGTLSATDPVFTTCNFKLALRKLDSMTPDEALELCKYVDPAEYGQYRFQKWEPELEDTENGLWKAYNVKNKNANVWFQIDLIDGHIGLYRSKDNEPEARIARNNYWIWYLDKYFDLPFPPENKTLIDMGYAVDINSLDPAIFLNK